jgi:APA family basic amino acid/polyamine antiporter
VLRRTQPDMPRPFRVPVAQFTGPAGVFVCFAMAYALPHDTWIRLAIWTAIGAAVYIGYGYRHSRLRQQMGSDPS